MTWDIGWHATFYGLFYENCAIPSIRIFFFFLALRSALSLFLLCLYYDMCVVCLDGGDISVWEPNNRAHGQIQRVVGTGIRMLSVYRGRRGFVFWSCRSVLFVVRVSICSAVVDIRSLSVLRSPCTDSRMSSVRSPYSVNVHT